MSDNTISQRSILFVGDFHAKTSRLPEIGRAWLESKASYGSSSIEFLRRLGRLGLLSKTSPACYPATGGGILPPSFAGWSNSGMASPGGYLTLSISESPNDAVESSLSDILETDAPQKYFLSPKACQGVLKRAERRGRPLPEPLAQALTQVATTDRTPTTHEIT